MDSVFEKFGLYDFFCVFLSGMIAIIISRIIGIPQIEMWVDSENSSISVLYFLLGSYFTGIVLQEISSFLDKKIVCFQFREKACSNFLNLNNQVIKNELELQSYQKMANKILNISDLQFYNPEQCEYVYYICKSYLELNSKSEKINRINSIYGLSRSVSLALLIITIWGGITANECLDTYIVFILIALVFLFYERCKRFSTYRVRVILRQYYVANNRNHKK